MNRERAKELLPIILAFADGKTIEFKNTFGDWINCDEIMFNRPPKDYRIKPDPKCRPFANAEECWQEMQKHQPFGWIKASHGQFHITGIKNNEINFGVNENWQGYNYIFDSYTFADGTPFGIKLG